jgi:flagellar protein FliS
MSVQRGLSSYRQTQVQSSTPMELVVMLYDGALTSLRIARQAIEQRDIRARRDALTRAMKIVSELQSTLNMDEGGQVASSLDELYAFVNARMLQAASQNAVAPLDEAIRVFEPLRDAFAEVASGPAVPGAAAAVDVRGAA